MTDNKKLKILALHGFEQSDKIFSSKLGSLRRKLKKETDFIFIRGPYKVPLTEKWNYNKDESNKEVSLCSNSVKAKYGWWTKNTEDTDLTEKTFNDSVELIKRTFEKQGPFDGILGFSQGASFLAVLCAMQQKKIISIEFKFAIFVSGFKSPHKQHEFYYDEKISLPSLHIYGTSDRITHNDRSIALANVFTNKKIVIHEGGHHVPGKREIFGSFIEEMYKEKNSMNKNR